MSLSNSTDVWFAGSHNSLCAIHIWCCRHNCPSVSNQNQQDSDNDGFGNQCDPCPNLNNLFDSDGDGIPDCFDHCPDDPNSGSGENDQDGDGIDDEAKESSGVISDEIILSHDNI